RLALVLSAPGFDASRTTRVCVSGVVTHTSLEKGTYATPAGDDGIVTHLPSLSVAVSTGHTSLEARLPTKAKPSPTETALGPALYLRPLRSRSAVLSPSTRVKLALAMS